MQRTGTHVRLSVCPWMCCMQSRIAWSRTVLLIPRISTARLSARVTHDWRPSFLTLKDTLSYLHPSTIRAYWDQLDYETWSSPGFSISSGGSPRAAEQSAEPRRGWQEAVEGGKARFRIVMGGGGYLLITTVRDHSGINFCTLTAPSSSRRGLVMASGV